MEHAYSMGIKESKSLFYALFHFIFKDLMSNSRTIFVDILVCCHGRRAAEWSGGAVSFLSLCDGKLSRIPTSCHQESGTWQGVETEEIL